MILTTVLSERTFPSLDPPPMLIPIPSHRVGSDDDDDDEDRVSHRGGVLVLGGKRIVFYEHASQGQQSTRQDKQRRTSKRITKSDKKETAAKEKAKERERESRKLPPRASVKWPWASVTA